MPRTTWAALAALLLLTHAPLRADAGRTTPGLVIETGARHAVADGISFSPDGAELFAWGEDKVIRHWPVGLGGFLDQKSAGLRWPILREQRGSVFALAHSHDGKRVAVGGFGLKTGLVAVIDKKPGGGGGAVPARVLSGEVNWSIAFSPDDKYVIYGNDKGMIFRWTPGSKDDPVRFAGSGGKGDVENPVRLLAFTGDDAFLSVSADRVVRRWSVSDPSLPAGVVARFTVPNVFRAVISPNGRWLAAAGTAIKGTEEEREAIGVVELIDLKAGSPSPTRHKVPADGIFRTIRCLAFDGTSTRLAVGCQEVPSAVVGGAFFRVIGGSVLIRDLEKDRWNTAGTINLSYRAEALAFHPKRSSMLAVAGGDSHEVGLYSASTGKPLGARAIIRGPANCVWGVAFSKNGKYFGWQDQRAKEPTGRNDWGGGPWRVFDIGRHEIKASAPADFDPVAPVETMGGWSVEPTLSAGVWEVVGPKGTRVRLEGKDGSLYNNRYNQTPRCWTFIKPAEEGGPVRLAIGHQWGLSLYECRPKDVRLVRIMNGHEGEVVSVAPSPDGKLLLTGARDLTLCCWSLAPWKSGTEMGAGFAEKGGKVVVTAVDTGSPAWEPLNPLRGTDEEANRLKAGDVIDLLIIKNEKFVYDPEGLYAGEVKRGVVSRLTDTPTKDPKEALALLKVTKANQEYLIGKRVGDKGDIIYKLTTVRQRPLWRFFATRAETGREWVIWRPRDFFYDTSANGDQYVGWHVNDPNLAAAPAFHPLERYRGTDRVGKAGSRNGFHRKDKIWPELLNPLPVVESVVFTDIEAPKVEVQVLKPAGVDADLDIQLSAAPQDTTKAGQRFTRVVLCVNETELPDPGLKPNALGRITNAKLTVPRARLRWGENTITVRVFNEAGGRGEGAVLTEYTPKGKPTATLHALCVGVNEYDSRDLSPLACSETDAKEMSEVLKQHTRSGGFSKANVVSVTGKNATATRILSELTKLTAAVKPDDWLVVFLSGHGEVEYEKGPDGKIRYVDKKSVPIPGSYFYPGQDYDEKKPSTRLTTKELFTVLAKADCRKLVILDTCHSGGAAVIPADSARDVSRDGMKFLVIASCQINQEALEPDRPDEKFKHGFFTHALLDIVSPSKAAAVGKRLSAVSSGELHKRLPVELKNVLSAFGVKKDGRFADRVYEPAFLLPGPPSTAVLHKPDAK